MSKIGNYTYTFGKQYKIYATNLSTNELLNYKINNLPNNTIIMSSLTDDEGNDINKPAILMTDNESNILPFTYSFNTYQFCFNNDTNTVSLKNYDELNQEINNLKNEVSTLKKLIQSINISYYN